LRIGDTEYEKSTAELRPALCLLLITDGAIEIEQARSSVLHKTILGSGKKLLTRAYRRAGASVPHTSRIN
jgi:hypothetical protein